MKSLALHKIGVKRVLLTLASVALVPAAYIYTAYAIQNRPQAELESEQASPAQVSVIEVTPGVHAAAIRANGEARPRFELTLTSDVSGRIADVSTRLESGMQLDAREVLVSIDPTAYAQGLAAAKQTLSEAKLAYLQELREAEHAQTEWSRANPSYAKATPLVLRKPQLAAAQAGVEQAEAMLKQAERDLAHTKIKAPFSSVVVERAVAPGQYVQPGDAIATLYSTDRIDVRITLPQQEWALLPERQDMMLQTQVKLTNADGHVWLGTVTQVDQHINPQNRQRGLVVSVFDPLKQPVPLLAGTFLQAEFAGASRQDILAVPASSLTRHGDIWYVDQAGQLARFSADVRFQHNGTLYVSRPDSTSLKALDALAIVARPLPSYVPGQPVLTQPLVEVGS